jgi:TRAP-type C4-dicarboxylate transport system substrate-binding protein
MKNQNNYLIIAVSFVFIFCSVFIAFSADSKTKESKVVLKIATPFKEGHILTDAAQNFKSAIEKESKGKIEVKIEAGIDTEDIQISGGIILEAFSPQYAFFNAPYVLRDYDHFLKVWNSPLGTKTKEQLSKNGNMESLGTVFRGYRQMTTKKSIITPEDLSGLKLRLPVVATWVKVWESLGTKPIGIPLTGLYQSLKDGTADASEGDLTQIQSFKLNEVQSHIILTNHLCAVGWSMINGNTYKKLSSSDKKLVAENMRKACEWATQKTKDSDSSKLKELQTTGMTIITPKADAIREKAKPAIEDLFKSGWPVTTWAEVLKY